MTMPSRICTGITVRKKRSVSPSVSQKVWSERTFV